MLKLENFYCLTINEERYNYTCDVFCRYNLPIPIKYLGFIGEDKERCCLYGHMSILMMARCLNLPYVFIFEDDAYPRKDILQQLEYYLSDDVVDRCGCVVLGRNGKKGQLTYTLDNKYFTMCERPFGAHAYVVFKKCYDEILKSMEKERISDIALRGNNFSDLNKPYWPIENLFIQKNLDDNCMSKNFVNKYGHYFYPKEDGTLGVFDVLPSNGMWE